MRDFLRDQSSSELSGWLAYTHIEDEIWTQRIMQAVARVFGSGKAQSARSIDDDEEVIDTTSPEFAQTFKGFTGAPGQAQRPQRPMRSTEIKFG